MQIHLLATKESNSQWAISYSSRKLEMETEPIKELVGIMQLLQHGLFLSS